MLYSVCDVNSAVTRQPKNNNNLSGIQQKIENYWYSVDLTNCGYPQVEITQQMYTYY